MKRIATHVALAVLLTVASAVVLLGGAARATGGPVGESGADGASKRTGTLRLVSTNPVTVTGARFLARERVVVRSTLNGNRLIRRTRASAAGRFTATFTGQAVADRCNSDLRVSATGSGGTEAVLKPGPQPQCPPSLRTP